jgi:hypothetical protein
MKKKLTNKREVNSRLFELESAVRRLSNGLSTKDTGSDSSKDKGIIVVKGSKKKDKKKHERNSNQIASADNPSQFEERDLYEEENVSEGVQTKEDSSIEEPRKTTSNDVKYISLTISDGKLVEASFGQTAYYRSWQQKGKYFFEFNCERQRMKKAINNRTAILDPCCNKESSSVLPDEANYIESIRPGELDSDFNIIKKATIKFIR